MLPTLLLLAFQPQAFQYAVTADRGLNLTVAGVPIVRGSWVQYYEPDWSKAYYNSVNSVQTVQTLPNGDSVVMFRSQDGKAYGTELFSPLPDGLKVTYSFGWTGDKPVSIELTAGALWAEPLQHGTLTIDGQPARSLQAATYTSDEVKPRSYSTAGREFIFDTAAGKLVFRGVSSGWTCFDARNLKKAWAQGQDLYWLGMLAMPLKPNEIATTEAEWHFIPNTAAPPPGADITLTPERTPAALHPDDSFFPLIPQPKQSTVSRDTPLVLGTDVDADWTDSDPSIKDDLLKAITNRWSIPGLRVRTDGMPKVFLRLQNVGLPAEGYEIRISPKYAMVLGQDVDGLKHAVWTLSQLFFAKDGKLCLPSGIIRDWPSVGWRGVHLFVGPEALAFHQKLWDRVLMPLKFNKVVLECERTAWHALGPEKPTGFMSRADLLKLFDYYRELRVEPTPLIQSFGHMDWLFAGKQNLDLALYSEPATSIDPRLPKSKELIYRVWDEAISLLHPRSVHFGLDEVEVKWPTKDAGLMTALWQMQLPYLGSIAAKHNVKMMCWGDQCLAPGEAIDAALAETKDEAKRRRDAIPRDAIITDWHYKNDPSPERFNTSLQLWKSEGETPIAATWFRPENIRGFYLAAIQQGAGTLQTTWAGHESNERRMLAEFRQFAAMVVAADYAWSGRKDEWDKLGYDPWEVFGRMYFGEPSHLTASPGQLATTGSGLQAKLGDVEFKFFGPFSLRSLLSTQTAQLPEQLTLETPGFKGNELALALDTAVSAEDNQVVGELEIDTDAGAVNKSIVYGQDVRSTADNRAIACGIRQNGLSLVRLDLGQETHVNKIVLRGTSAYAGLRIHGVTTITR